MVGTTGFEPATSSVSRKRSNQLSYAPAGQLWLFYQDRSGGKRLGVVSWSPMLYHHSRMQKTAAPARRSAAAQVEHSMADDASTKLNPFRTAPNLLTLARICLAPFLVAAILDGHYGLSFVLFVVAGLTDGLDGTLARVLQQRTVVGSYLDPVADKLLLSTLFLVLMHQGLIPARVTVWFSAGMWASWWLPPFSMRRRAGGSLPPASSARPTPLPRSPPWPRCCCTS